jgi:hypothetical protein
MLQTEHKLVHTNGMVRDPDMGWAPIMGQGALLWKSMMKFYPKREQKIGDFS